MKNSIICFFATCLLLFLGCSNSNTKDQANTDEKFEVSVPDQKNEDIAILEDAKDEDVVFYNMFSPLDLNRIIDEKNAYFNSGYVNSLNNLTRYESSQKIALNIGVYGADLSYLWMFEQTQQAISYLSAIQHLTSKLGIPKNFVESTFKAAENNSTQFDSLISIARIAYSTTDKFLKESDRESAAVLILLGGWIETLHITLNMYTMPNSKLAGKIISQKYSLSTLINMVQNSQDNLQMSEYLLLLKKLNDSFKTLESLLKPEDIQIDTINKRISIKDSYNMNIDPKQFSEIKVLTQRIREHIIE